MVDLSSDLSGVATIRYVTHVAQIFSDVVRRHPGRPALVWAPAQATSYQRLDQASNQMARLLLARGVHKRDAICICLEKQLVTYACILACLKVGLPYFIVDPANPSARTRTMLDRCRPVLAFVAPSADLDVFCCPAIAVDESLAPSLLESLSEEPVALDWSIDGSDPAYIMFTSGSTGAPKGVTISQSNLVNFIFWSQDQFDTTPADVFTNVNPLFFDNSVFDIYASLFAGASLVPFTAATLRDPQAIVSRIEALGCTVYFSVPSLLVYLQTMKLLTPASVPSLRKIIFGGAGYPKPMLAKLFQALGARAALYNVYGPTECTCICSVYRVGAGDFADMTGYAPLGRLIANFSYVIVDEHGARVAPGVTGELCLGGPCVGLGYYADPALTASVFVQNPTHHDFFDRVYKTGDFVRVDPADGQIRFVGRADTQIKHQGYRIELGEIEHALNAIDGVDEAAAVYVSHGAGGRIVAFVAAKKALEPGAVKRSLASRVPKYMIPDRVLVVDELAKNANGKIDRQAMSACVAREDT
jgi:D-alanine--poly(phosphoribitol) ligase subunit 1